jgi:hypothetical protein
MASHLCSEIICINPSLGECALSSIPLPSAKKAKLPEGRIAFPSIDHGKTSTGNRDWRTNPHWYIQEKMDGSQFSFSAHAGENGERYMVYTCGNAVRTRDAALFRKAIDVLWQLRDDLTLGWVYHSEMLTATRHNIVDYDRMPRHFVVVYDISTEKPYTGIDEIERECTRVGLEWVPAFVKNTDPEVNPHTKCLELVAAIDRNEIKSMLGGKPEGVVLKCPGFVDPKGKTTNVKVKYVTPRFEEVRHLKKPERRRQTPTEFIAWVGAHFDLPARFSKARQHLAQRDDVLETDTPEYRKLLEEELDRDLKKEQSEMIRAFIENEYPTWINPRHEAAFIDDPLFPMIKIVRDDEGKILDAGRDETYTNLLPHVLAAARASI